jgi:hypothetical protein
MNEKELREALIDLGRLYHEALQNNADNWDIWRELFLKRRL